MRRGAGAHDVKSGLSDEFPNERGVLGRMQSRQKSVVGRDEGGIARNLKVNVGFVHIDFRSDPVKV